MRIIGFLLSFYIIMLAAYPCVDTHDISHANITSQLEENHSHEHATDLCSPFCVCNCCGQQVLTFLDIVNYVVPTKFEEIRTSNSIYTSVFHSNFYGSIWQPPKITA